MQVTTDLRPMFNYSLLPTLISFIIIIIIILIILFLKYKKKKEIVKEIVIPKNINIYEIKNKYLGLINNLLNDFSDERIDNRHAYQVLSKLIRNFIYETTNIKVQNYTLNDIKETNIPILYELVKEYYDPEFNNISKGNIISSIDKTRKVIERWN